MTVKNLGIIGGGQLGSMLSSAAKKLDIKTVVYSDDKDAPAQNFCDEFIFGDKMTNKKYWNLLVELMLLVMNLKIFLMKLLTK